jgi:hypothetical protein
MIRDVGEYVTQIGFRVEVVKLSRVDKGVNRSATIRNKATLATRSGRDNSLSFFATPYVPVTAYVIPDFRVEFES